MNKDLEGVVVGLLNLLTKGAKTFTEDLFKLECTERGGDVLFVGSLNHISPNKVGIAIGSRGSINNIVATKEGAKKIIDALQKLIDEDKPETKEAA